MSAAKLTVKWTLTRLMGPNKINPCRQFHSSIGCATLMTKKFNPNTTVDQDEVDKHTKMMKEWWNPAGPMKALHSYNLIRVPFIRDGLLEGSKVEKSLSPLKGLKILDVGCGGGLLSEPLARLGAKVTGIDASKELVELANQHSCTNRKIADNQPTYLCSTIEDHATKHENHYDGVVASEIIEHINNKELFIKSCVQTLKPRGKIFFTTPTRSKLSQFTVIFLAEYVFKMIPQGTHQIDKFTTPVELSFMLERNNCHVESVLGIFYNVLTNRWSWISNQSQMFALQAVKLAEKQECGSVK